MSLIEISSPSDPALSPYRDLTDAQLASREGLMIAEGVKVIASALSSGAKCVSLLMEKKHATGKARALVEGCACPVYLADRALLKEITGFELTRGVLGCFERPAGRTAEEVLSGASLVVVFDGLNDAENLGALYRSAAALGADGALLTSRCRDPLSRRTLRVSMGTVLSLPWARMPALEEGGAALLRSFGFETVALALRDDAVEITDARIKEIRKKALVLGPEGDGLSDDAIAACDHRAIIPMRRGVDSLNVAAAGAVAMWEMVRG